MISSNVSGAASYAAVVQGLDRSAPAQGTDPAAGDGSFGAALQGAMSGLSDLGEAADAKSVAALGGKGNLTDVVMAVSKAEMALQASVAVRDKVVSAYQDIMRMAV